MSKRQPLARLLHDYREAFLQSGLCVECGPAPLLRSVWIKAGRMLKVLSHSRPSRGRAMLPCSPAAPPATPQGGGFAGSGGVRLSPRLPGHSQGLGSRMRCESSPQQYAPPAPTPPKLLPRRPKHLTNARPPRSPGGDPVDVRADALPAPAQGHGHGARCVSPIAGGPNLTLD